jgi:hypothetical protein
MELIALGSLIVGGISLLWNLISGSSQQDLNEKSLDLQKKEAYSNASSTLLTMQQDQENISNSITSTEGSISEYEQFLERYPAYEQLQKETKLVEGKAEYQELAENFAASEVLAASRGTTGSSTLMSKQKQTDIKTMFGEDMTVDANGGLFGQELSELSLDLEAEKTSAESQLDILNTSLESLKTSYDTYTPSIDTQKTLVEKLKAEAGL